MRMLRSAVDLKLMRMKSSWTRRVLCAVFIALHCSIDEISSTCTQSPIITGYSRSHGTLVYNFTWKISTCHSDIYQYELQFVESCSITQPVTVSTGNNRTTTLIVIPSCTASGCYVRIRAQMTNQLFTDYSPCVLITSNFPERKFHVEHTYGEVCVPIQGTCSHGFTSEFFINGHSVLWPEHNASDFRTTYSPVTELYRFCIINVTSNITFTEYCYQDHTTGCSLCSVDSGEVHFLSHSSIILELSPSRHMNNHSSVSYGRETQETTYGIKTDVSTSHYFLDEYYNKSRNLEGNILSVTGAISIATACSLIGMCLLALIITILWHHKQSKKLCLGIQGESKTESDNIYDEPSLPDPIYQELDVNMKTTDTKMNMTRNDSYSTTVLKINDSYTPSFIVKET